MKAFVGAEIVPSASNLRPGGSTAVATRSAAASTTTTSFTVTAATSVRAATATSTTTSTATARLAFTAATAEASTAASGSTRDLVEAVVGYTVGRGVSCSFLAGRLGVPGLASKVASGRLVGPARGLLRSGLSWGCGRDVDFVVRPGNDLVAVLKTFLFGAGGCVPTLAGNVAFGLGVGRSILLDCGAVGLGLLELGQAGVCSGGVGPIFGGCFGS